MQSTPWRWGIISVACFLVVAGALFLQSSTGTAEREWISAPKSLSEFDKDLNQLQSRASVLKRDLCNSPETETDECRELGEIDVALKEIRGELASAREGERNLSDREERELADELSRIRVSLDSIRLVR